LTESLTLLKSVPFLAPLTAHELEQIAAQTSLVTASPGELIIREGEVGDCMYVIERGSVQVLTTSFDGSDLVLARLEAGQWFGEQVLLPGSTGRRNASLRALEESAFLVLSRELFQHALAKNSKLLEQMRATGEEQRALRSGKLREGAFASLGFSSGAGSYRIESYRVGAPVFHQGDPGDRLYLILSGRARVKKTEGDRETVLAELLPGQFFGELAILREAPRSATVEASEDLEVVSLDGAWFREAHDKNPALRSLMDSLASIYLLPRRGLLTLQTGQLDGKPTVTAVHNLPDGRRVLSTRLAGVAAFTAQVLDAPEAAAVQSVVYDNRELGLRRELEIAGGKLIGLDAEGEWTGLGDMFSLLLDGTPVEEWQLVLFRERGDFHVRQIQPLYEENEVICTCTHTTCGKIMQAIRDNCTTLEAVAQRTNATRVCGGCAPLVRELLGQASWTAAHVVEMVPLTEDVRSFRLRPVSGPCLAWLPGQHLVLQARIDNRWVQRAYTLSCAPGSGYYEITVKKEPQGVFSRWLFDRMPPDAMLRISEPGGEYCLPADQSSDVVCLVGGIGVTPALSMARTLAAQPKTFRLHVHYSASEESDLAGREELAALARKTPRISVETLVTRKQGRCGLDQIREVTGRFPDALYFLCGSPSYMTAVSAHLRECGVPDKRVRIELFTVAGAKVEQGAPERRCPVAHSATAAEPPATPVEQARSMLRECYQEANALSVFDARWRQVEDEFQRTGTYHQTYEELVFAARVAWRNSVKCIGRLYWQGLAVRDFRHAETEEEMFEAIFSHIETAMNGGNIRPLMTVFPPSDKAGQAPRVWNAQIFRYAGYPQKDGSVLGDPANLEFTEAAIGLGWTPPAERGRFDLLPVILEAGGRPPQWREIPKKLVVEVPILHPDFPGFKDLGLKWYALRLVSGVMLDGGGVQYSAAPFNGWSMETEIGARIFTDVQRYNQLPQVAKVMGLDTSSDRTLWRDRALVELNVAVLYSFEKAGVKIMDHHAASQAFMKFDEQESRAGRTTYARWSWIVPPISGSLTPVFHHEWPDVELKPNYVAQPEPWKK